MYPVALALLLLITQGQIAMIQNLSQTRRGSLLATSDNIMP